ncbi:MAG: hypothetical protein AAGI17_04755 [Planctomycetota bacterium]
MLREQTLDRTFPTFEAEGIDSEALGRWQRERHGFLDRWKLLSPSDEVEIGTLDRCSPLAPSLLQAPLLRPITKYLTRCYELRTRDAEVIALIEQDQQNLRLAYGLSILSRHNSLSVTTLLSITAAVLIHHHASTITE